MSRHPNKLVQFWQELKRRKVFRVLAMYAATAFIILQVVDIVLPRFGLPDWTVTFIIILLIVGLPISIVLSWIFDLTTEGIKKTESIDNAQEKEISVIPVRRKFTISDRIIVVLLIIVCILLYSKIFRTDRFKDIRDDDGRISIAVMPFENLTGDKTLDWFQRGLSSLVINGLGSSPELSVCDDHTMYEVIESMGQVYTAGFIPSLAKEVANKVEANNYISGSCQGGNGKYKILANVVDTESGEVIWTNSVKGDINSSEYLDMADSLCKSIKDFLEIKVIKQGVNYDFKEAYTESSEAYRYFIEGMNSILTLNYNSAIESFNKALKIDSSFTLAKFFIAWAYLSDPKWQFDYVEPWIIKAYQGKDKLPLKYQLWIEFYYAFYISKNLPDIIKSCNLLENSNIQSRLLLFDIGTHYLFLDYPENAVKAFEKVVQISNERGRYWEYRPFYTSYGEALHKTGKHEKEIEIYELALKICPEVHGAKDPILYNQAVCALSRGDTIQSGELMQNIKNRIEELGYPEHVKEFFIGYVYEDADMIDKAGIHFRNLYNLAPKGDRIATYTWGRYLIKFNININRGMELVDQVLEMVSPDEKIYLVYLYMKSVAYYMQGNYDEAQQLIKRVDEGWVGFYPDLHQLKQKIEKELVSSNKDKPIELQGGQKK